MSPTNHDLTMPMGLKAVIYIVENKKNENSKKKNGASFITFLFLSSMFFFLLG